METDPKQLRERDGMVFSEDTTFERLMSMPAKHRLEKEEPKEVPWGTPINWTAMATVATPEPDLVIDEPDCGVFKSAVMPSYTADDGTVWPNLSQYMEYLYLLREEEEQERDDLKWTIGLGKANASRLKKAKMSKSEANVTRIKPKGKRRRRICTCGDPVCQIGPFKYTEEES